jgi:hypothetical protein
MKQILGNFIEPEEGHGEYLKIGFLPSSIPLQQRWRNNGLSADFLAGYVSTFFPGDDQASNARQAEIKDAISFIANELLENAMKFTHTSAHHTVTIEMFLQADVIRLYTINCIDPEQIDDFQQFIGRLLTADTNALYTEQLERNADADAEGDGASGLGFLTMINDYGASLAWKFTALGQDRDDIALTTMVRLPV